METILLIENDPANLVNNGSGTLGIHLVQFVGYVLLFILHAGKMLGPLGYSGPILIDTSLNSILGVPWLRSMSMGSVLFPRPGSELDDEVAFSVSTTSEALRESPDGVAMDILRYDQE